MMLEPGELTVALHRAPGRGGCVGVSVAPPPALPLDRLFIGQRPEEAVKRAGMVFNVCGAAQAAATALALGVAPARDAPKRILLETLRDHALKLAVAWPEALGIPPDRQALTAVSALPGDAGAALSRALLGPDGLPDDLAGFEAWLDAGQTAPARVLARLWRDWAPGWGAVTLPLWPGLSATGLDMARAAWRGSPFETGLPALHAGHPLLRAIAARQGRSLVWRLAARLVDTASASDALAGRAPMPVLKGLAAGVGTAPAARGTMLVTGRVEKGAVTALARLSPTDAALHPEGLLPRAMATLPAEPDAPMLTIARMVVEATDPCLMYRIVDAPLPPPGSTVWAVKPGAHRNVEAPAAGARTNSEDHHVHSLRMLG